MSSMDPNEIPSSRARRHFLGVAGAAGARLAGVAVVAMAIASSPARAMGRNWGPRGGGHGGGGHGGGGGSDGGGAKCLLRGSRIATPTGDTCVEELKIGDLVKTASGENKAIRWIGRQAFKNAGASWVESVMPVRISQGALAAGIPNRDLYVSPGHAIYANGVLIRAKDLVNHSSIVPGLPASTSTLEYYNILLDTHDAVLANGMPVETFQLWGHAYENFDNSAEVENLYPAAVRPHMAAFAPVVGEESGRQHLKALLLLGISHIVPTRDRFKEVSERIAARASESVC